MANGSSIEWTEATWNPVSGCTRASPGCDNCYAVLMSYRLECMAKADIAAEKNPGKKAHYISLTVLNGKGDRHFNGVVRTLEDALKIPLGWKKPRKIFVNSQSDLFHKAVPFDFIDKVFAVMALCPQHVFQVLTKRPERMAEYLTAKRCNVPVYNAAAEMINDDWARMPGDMASTRSSGGTWWPLRNVWLGVSCENQQTADERIPHLLRCPAAVRFISAEPLLGAVNLKSIKDDGVGYTDALLGYSRCDGRNEAAEHANIDWVIVGGESGHGARACNVEWIRSIVRQCKAAAVPCFVKQLGAKATYEWSNPNNTTQDTTETCIARLSDPKGGNPKEWPEDLRVRQMPTVGEPHS